MKFDLSKIELEKDDLGTLEYIIDEAVDGYSEVSSKEMLSIWNEIPDLIKLDALKWGIDDTEVRDQIYLWVKNNLNKQI